MDREFARVVRLLSEKRLPHMPKDVRWALRHRYFAVQGLTTAQRREREKAKKILRRVGIER